MNNAFSDLDLKAVFGFSMVILSIFTIGSAFSEEEETKFNKDVNELINDGLNECSDLFDKPNCLGVMSVLDELCKVDYYPECFGDQWMFYFDYMSTLAKSGHNYNDEYLNQNNEHFGNSSMDKSD